MKNNFYKLSLLTLLFLYGCATFRGTGFLGKVDPDIAGIDAVAFSPDGKYIAAGGSGVSILDAFAIVPKM
ncbi:MAG: hypothetical protein JXB88_14580 [Spirochaetales bacterium]|nr:hypothetical protein [Spirochaetales bacterium]